jgi:hypothetical protein
VAATTIEMGGIQAGDVVETKKQPTRKGRVLKSSAYLTWLVEFKDEEGSTYTDTLKSSQLKKISTDEAHPKSNGFKQAVQHAVGAITPKKKKKGVARDEARPQRQARHIPAEARSPAQLEVDDDHIEEILEEDGDNRSSSSRSSSSSFKPPTRVTTHRQKQKNNDATSSGGHDSTTGHEDDSSEKTPTHGSHDGDNASRSLSTASSLLHQSTLEQENDGADITDTDDAGDADDDDDEFGSVHVDEDEEEEEELLEGSDEDEDDKDDDSFDSMDEDHIMEDPTGQYVANLEQGHRFRWKQRLYEQEKSKLLADKWSVTVVPSDAGRKIAVGSLVKRKKKPQLEGEVIEKVGKKWKVRHCISHMDN